MEDLNEYKITMPQKIQSKKEVLDEAYQTCTSDEEPELIYITAGPGAGKSSAERYFQKKLFVNRGIIPFIFNSDKLATYHPKSDEALKTLLPHIYYKVTRWFVRPAAPFILNELRKSKISLINENTLDHGESDIEETKRFKEAGYKVKANVIATDIFVSRLSCFEREAAQLRNGSIPTIRKLDELGLLDEVNVFTRGKTVADDPILIYKKGDRKYKDFKEAIDVERNRQREILLNNSEQYFERIQKARETIAELGENEELTQNALKGLDDLEKDFAIEVLQHKRVAAVEAIKGKSELKNEIYDLLLKMSNEHRVEDVDDVCDFMQEIEEKYELKYKGELPISKMYTELCNYKEKDPSKEKESTLEEGGTSKDSTGSDEKIFADSNGDIKEEVRLAKERIMLYDSLLRNVELSTYEQQLLLERLKKIQKYYDDRAKQEGVSEIKHPTIEDFRE